MVESVFEYGPRVGCWRLLRIFKKFDVKVSVLGVVRGLQHIPNSTRAFVEAGHEIVSHGWRWLDYHHMDEAEEREHIRLAVDGVRKLTARRRSAGSTAARASTRASFWSSTAAFPTIATISATNCRSGSRS